MTAVRVPDILFRFGAKNLERFQSLAVAGAGRGPRPVLPYTHTRATVRRPFRDRDGTARRAAAGKLAMDWPTGLVDASGNAIGGPVSEGARTQLATAPENFGAWTVGSGSPVLTSGQADPFGGTAAYLVGDDSAAAEEYLYLPVTYTGDATKAVSIYMKAGTSVKSTVALFDVTAAAHRHTLSVAWSGGVPTLATLLGGGVLFAPEAWGGGWYRLSFNATGVVAANTNRVYLYPVERGVVAAVGDVNAFGCNAWNSPFPASYQSPTEGTGVADALSTSYNFGPRDITVLIRLARPLHADAGASTALGVSPGIFSFGAGSAPRIGAYFDPAARNIISVIDTATTDATQTTAIPAGQPTICIQYRNLTTGGSTALDVGSGLTAFSSAATAFSAFASQTLRIGRYDDELYGVIGDFLVARGLFTRAEMMAVL